MSQILIILEIAYMLLANLFVEMFPIKKEITDPKRTL